jgi:crotonobetainyl-CoA:carnitine CoA-transferase CaiB-like acyl-CoA transferase
VTKEALEGLRVVECANLRAGPYCAKLLADLGAAVIKVEDPGGGDESRRCGPFPDDDPHLEKSGLFLWLNANKFGITLNLRSLLGRKILKRLLKVTDIFIEDFPPSVARELGLDYKTLKEVNPQLIVTSITPFGQGGPYKNHRAYEINCSAAGGLSNATGEPRREPLIFPVSAADYQAGISAAAASITAVLCRGRIGRGQHIDISEVEVLANDHAGQYVVAYIYRGVSGTRRGHHAGYFYYPCSCLPCKDGYVVLMAPQVAQWIKFVELMGNPEWSQNPRYRNRRAMFEEYPDEADGLLLPWLKEHKKDEIFLLGLNNHLPFAPVKTIDEVMNAPQLKVREFFWNSRHPEAGMLKFPGPAYKLSRTPSTLKRPAPRLGEHNRQVLCGDLRYSEEDLTKLREFGVI